MAQMIAYEALTVAATAVSFTKATINQAKAAVIIVETAPINWRGDGTAPTASVGFPIDIGRGMVLVGEGSIEKAQFIRQGSVSATVHGAFFDQHDVAQFLGTKFMEGSIAHDSAQSGNPVKIGGRAYTGTPSAVANADMVDAFFDQFGAQAVKMVNPTDGTDHFVANVFKAVNGAGSGGDVSAWTPASGKKFRLLGYALVSGAAGVGEIKDGTSTVIAVWNGPAEGPMTHIDLGPQGILSASADNVLTVNGPGSGAVSGLVWGVEE
jgi:hypothetical protein